MLKQTEESRISDCELEFYTPTEFKIHDDKNTDYPGIFIKEKSEKDWLMHNCKVYSYTIKLINKMSKCVIVDINIILEKKISDEKLKSFISLNFPKYKLDKIYKFVGEYKEISNKKEVDAKIDYEKKPFISIELVPMKYKISERKISKALCAVVAILICITTIISCMHYFNLIGYDNASHIINSILICVVSVAMLIYLAINI